MTNKQLQNILKQYPEECEILINDVENNFNEPSFITAEYYADDFEISKLIIHYMGR